jgi:hypothetical protein
MPTLTSKQALTQARALIENPANWTTGNYARDDKGKPTDPSYPNATCFCAIGALVKVNGVDLGFSDMPGLAELRLAADRSGLGRNVTHINDSLGHQVALDMFAWAICLCPAEAA